jgi:hypothetical protein
MSTLSGASPRAAAPRAPARRARAPRARAAAPRRAAASPRRAAAAAARRAAPRAAARRGGAEPLDAVDAEQESDIRRLAALVAELQARLEHLEGEVAANEAKDRDRVVALKALVRDGGGRAAGAAGGGGGGGALASSIDGDAGADFGAAELESGLDKDGNNKWTAFQNNFTMLVSKAHLQTAAQLRDRLMGVEWELGSRAGALRLGVARFEAAAAAGGLSVSFVELSALYDDPLNYAVIADERARMAARAAVSEAEALGREKAFAACTLEARALAEQFSTAQLVSKLLPDPLEAGVVEGLKKAAGLSKWLGGGA